MAGVSLSSKPCVKCGAINRDARGACLACMKVRCAAWEEKNRERRKFLKNTRAPKEGPCRKCGETERHKNGDCKACAQKRSAAYRGRHPHLVSEQKAAWYALNSDHVKRKSAAWYSNNKERALEACDAWHKAHPEKAAQSTAKWKSTHREAVRIYASNRRGKKKRNGGRLSSDLSAKLYKLQRGKCPCCGLPLEGDAELDHVVPIALGGANEDWNMQLLRKKCNKEKWMFHPVDFMQQRGFLI